MRRESFHLACVRSCSTWFGADVLPLRYRHRTASTACLQIERYASPQYRPIQATRELHQQTLWQERIFQRLPQQCNACQTLESRARSWVDANISKGILRWGLFLTYTSIRRSWPFSRFRWVRPIRMGSLKPFSSSERLTQLLRGPSRRSCETWVDRLGAAATDAVKAARAAMRVKCILIEMAERALYRKKESHVGPSTVYIASWWPRSAGNNENHTLLVQVSDIQSYCQLVRNNCLFWSCALSREVGISYIQSYDYFPYQDITKLSSTIVAPMELMNQSATQISDEHAPMTRAQDPCFCSADPRMNRKSRAVKRLSSRDWLTVDPRLDEQ